MVSELEMSRTNTLQKVEKSAQPINQRFVQLF